MDKDEKEKRIQDAEDIRLMQSTPGWKILESLLQEQLQAYISDNAMSADNWENYLNKRGKIFGIQLLLTNIEDYKRMGEEAKEDKVDNYSEDTNGQM
jgi:hypothetical protein